MFFIAYSEEQDERTVPLSCFFYFVRLDKAIGVSYHFFDWVKGEYRYGQTSEKKIIDRSVSCDDAGC